MLVRDIATSAVVTVGRDTAWSRDRGMVDAKRGKAAVHDCRSGCKGLG